MKLWLISQDEYLGYDSYDSAVVAAKDEDTARRMFPGTGELNKWVNGCWATKPENVKAVLVGTAVRGTQQSVICSSFNAG